MEAYQLKLIDEDQKIHWQAFLNFAVKATKKSGKNVKPVYSNFKKFYEATKGFEKTVKKKRGERFSGIGKLLRKEGT